VHGNGNKKSERTIKTKKQPLFKWAKMNKNIERAVIRIEKAFVRPI
jgi:hypothetical protein